MPVNRRLAALIICIAASLPMFLSGFFLGGRTMLRHMMREKMQSTELVYLQIPRSAIRWVEAGEEIRIASRMFDIRSIRYEGDTCQLTGLFDDDETTLFEQLTRSEEGRRQGAGMIPALLQVCLGITAITPPGIDPGVEMLAAEGLSFDRTGQASLRDGLHRMCTPPPEGRLS